MALFRTEISRNGMTAERDPGWRVAPEADGRRWAVPGSNGRPPACKARGHEADGGIRTHDPRFTRAVLWPTELRRRCGDECSPVVAPNRGRGGRVRRRSVVVE